MAISMMLAKDEFKALVLLYLAKSNGFIHEDEFSLMFEKADNVTFNNVRRMFGQMSDVEILECVDLNKARFLVTDHERWQMLNDLKSLVSAALHPSPMEVFICEELDKVIA